MLGRTGIGGMVSGIWKSAAASLGGKGTAPLRPVQPVGSNLPSLGCLPHPEGGPAWSAGWNPNPFTEARSR
jgi:hypothetical protein